MSLPKMQMTDSLSSQKNLLYNWMFVVGGLCLMIELLLLNRLFLNRVKMPRSQRRRK